jgi:hypothetical protein
VPGKCCEGCPIPLDDRLDKLRDGHDRGGGEYVEDGPQRESHSEPAHEHSRLLERSRTFIVAA